MTKSQIILSVATALTMGAQFMNDEAARAAMADMETAFGGKVIRMDAKPMPKDIARLLQQTEVSTTAKKRSLTPSPSPRRGE